MFKDPLKYSLANGLRTSALGSLWQYVCPLLAQTFLVLEMTFSFYCSPCFRTQNKSSSLSQAQRRLRWFGNKCQWEKWFKEPWFMEKESQKEFWMLHIPNDLFRVFQSKPFFTKKETVLDLEYCSAKYVKEHCQQLSDMGSFETYLVFLRWMYVCLKLTISFW